MKPAFGERDSVITTVTRFYAEFQFPRATARDVPSNFRDSSRRVSEMCRDLAEESWPFLFDLLRVRA